MDISTLLGLIIGIVCIVISIILGEGSVMQFVDGPSVFIVIGGLIAAMLVAYPIPRIVSGLKVAKYAFVKQTFEPVEAIKQINDLAQSARREGLLALEEIAQGLSDPFLKKGILLIVDATDGDLLRSILETEIAFIENRHKDNQKIWETFAELGPAWGMIGTLIGLIIMLGALSDPSTLGPKMAVALITTFYGSLIANFIATPISYKLKISNDEEVLHKQLIVEGLLSIQAGENPRVIEEKLKAFLSPKAREIFEAKQNSEE